MSYKKVIISNSVNMMIALSFRKLLTFIYVALIARYANIYTTGLFFYIMALLGFLGMLMDIGLSPVFIRESSRDIKQLPKYLWSIISIKMILCPLGIIVATSVVMAIDYPQLTKQLLYMVIIMMVLDSFSKTFFGSFRAHQKLKYEAQSMVIGHLLMLALGVYFLLGGYKITYLILAVLASSIFNFIYSIYLIYNKLDITPKIMFEREIIKDFLKKAFPFFIGSMVGMTILDTLVLSYYSDMQSVALFGLPASIIRGLQLIPLAAIAALYPQMSFLKNESPKKLSSTFQYSAYSLFIVSIPVAIGVTVLAPNILMSFYGSEFKGSVLPLQILAITIIPIFLNYLIGTLLDASNKQTVNTIIRAISASAHIIMCFIIIPLFNVIGAALVGLISNTFLLIMGTYWTIKILDKTIFMLFSDIVRIIIAGLLMGIVILYLKNYINFLLLIPLSMILFIILIVIFEKLTLKNNIRPNLLNIFKII